LRFLYHHEKDETSERYILTQYELSHAPSSSEIHTSRKEIATTVGTFLPKKVLYAQQENQGGILSTVPSRKYDSDAPNTRGYN
jgi:hypothetical protein